MIRVIIERFIAETLEEHYETAAKQTLQLAVCAPGFISGETLQDINNPRHRIVLCKWRSVKDWQDWQDSLKRKRMMSKLRLLFDKDEKITIFEAL